MSEYRRPQAEPTVFRDETGAVVEYGNRWGWEGPPADAYSVDRHPERFAPLHDVADALVAYLTATYDVDVQTDPPDAFHREQGNILRSVRLVPTSPEAAPLTVAWSTYPGVMLAAGVLFEDRFPDCGCDACDETWQGVADEIERYVFAVAEGRFREQVTRSRVSHFVVAPDGSPVCSSSGKTDRPRRDIAEARRRLRSLRAGWQPWPKTH